MNKDYYTVEQISKMLDIHPKTIQRYIRDGRLRASKVGKSWRINGHDLSVFIEGDSNEEQQIKQINLNTKINASSVIDINVDGKENAIRIMNALTGVMNSKPSEYGKSSVQAQFIEMENMVRITLWGEIRFMAAMMDMIISLMEQNERSY